MWEWGDWGGEIRSGEWRYGRGEWEVGDEGKGVGRGQMQEGSGEIGKRGVLE